jgi:hypothetical protein
MAGIRAVVKGVSAERWQDRMFPQASTSATSSCRTNRRLQFAYDPVAVAIKPSSLRNISPAANRWSRSNPEVQMNCLGSQAGPCTQSKRSAGQQSPSRDLRCRYARPFASGPLCPTAAPCHRCRPRRCASRRARRRRSKQWVDRRPRRWWKSLVRVVTFCCLSTPSAKEA